MSIGTTLTFQLPEGWTLRKVATALAREWLAPFRAEPAVKAARWVVQPVVEDPRDAESPLWEPGISTSEYEERLDRTDLAWVIRATAGRGKGIILARLVMADDSPAAFTLTSHPSSFPETLFNSEKIDEFLRSQTEEHNDDLFAALVTNNGFEVVTSLR